MDLSQGFHERLNRVPEKGEMRDGSIRYLMMRPDALMGMVHRLDPRIREAVLAALAASVAEFGGKSVSAYRLAGAAHRAALIQVIARTSAELGWGLWDFVELADGSFEVIVRNSPFADGAGRSDVPVCAPIAGILTAMSPLLVGDRVSVRETRCRSQDGTGACHFLVKKELE